jgi:hypothetical protein
MKSSSSVVELVMLLCSQVSTRINVELIVNSHEFVLTRKLCLYYPEVFAIIKFGACCLKIISLVS